jgi:hypothetical protein
MKKLKIYHFIIVFLIVSAFSACLKEPAYYMASDFAKIPKIDAHFHYLSTEGVYLEYATSLNFKLLTPIWDGEEVSIKDQLMVSVSIFKSYPGKYAFFGTFSVDSFNYP